MNFDFTKMEGCANDFIIFGPLSKRQTNAVISNIRLFCDRRRGIGGDGVIIVLPSNKADFRMRIFNSDGTEAEMCGNGIRCMVRYIRKRRLSRKTELSIETAAGTKRCKYCRHLIEIEMGPPVLKASDIPVALDFSPVIMYKLPLAGREYAITAVSMGNPHAVIFTDELTDELVLGVGKKLESHWLFPKRTNVEFVKVLSPTEIRMRVYERGCGETLACGTGASAAVVAGILNKILANTVTVHLLGGQLQIHWSGHTDDSVFMSGPTREVFDGRIRI